MKVARAFRILILIFFTAVLVTEEVPAFGTEYEADPTTHLEFRLLSKKEGGVPYWVGLGLEFKVSQDLDEFYHRFWLPYSQQNNFSSAECFWRVKTSNFQEWLHDFGNTDNVFPYSTYGPYFDAIKKVVN